MDRMTPNPFASPPGSINPFTGKPNNPITGAAVRPPSGGAGVAKSAPAPASAPTTPPSGGQDATEAGDPRIQALVQEGLALKARMDADSERYRQIRNELWDLVGQEAGPIPGTKSKFRAPSTTPRRSISYTVLENYPEAYEASVTFTPADPDAPGALYL